MESLTCPPTFSRTAPTLPLLFVCVLRLVHAGFISALQNALRKIRGGRHANFYLKAIIFLPLTADVIWSGTPYSFRVGQNKQPLLCLLSHPHPSSLQLSGRRAVAGAVGGGCLIKKKCHINSDKFKQSSFLIKLSYLHPVTYTHRRFRLIPVTIF